MPTFSTSRQRAVNALADIVDLDRAISAPATHSTYQLFWTRSLTSQLILMDQRAKDALLSASVAEHDLDEEVHAEVERRRIDRLRKIRAQRRARQDREELVLCGAFA